MFNLPTCSARFNLGELDCDAIHKKDCEQCLCNYHATGGTVHPYNGKNYPAWLCWLLYGPKGKSDE